MILLGLPNETIEYDPAFGEILVSVDDVTSVVTFIWCRKDMPNNLPVLYSAISTVYDSEVFDNLKRSKWITAVLTKWGQKFKHNEDTILRSNAVELFVVQAHAFANIETLKGKTHDRKSEPASTS